MTAHGSGSETLGDAPIATRFQPQRHRSAWLCLLLAAATFAARAGHSQAASSHDPHGTTRSQQAAMRDPEGSGLLFGLQGDRLVAEEAQPWPLDELSVWAWEGGAWRPVPWQHEEYSYIVDPDLPRLDDPTDLDAHDFLVLAVDDVGGRWAGDAQAGETWPPGIAPDVWPVRIHVSLAAGLPREGDLYLFRAPRPPEAAVEPRIRWDPSRNLVVSDQWAIGVRQARTGGFYLSHLSLGPEGPNLIAGWRQAFGPAGDEPLELVEPGGVPAQPTVIGPLRAVFERSDGKGDAMVTARMAWLGVGPGHDAPRDAKRKRIVMELAAGPETRWQDERFPGGDAGRDPVGATAPWPAWWTLDTAHGRLVALTDPAATCVRGRLQVSREPRADGASLLRLDARFPRDQFYGRRWPDLPLTLLAQTSAVKVDPAQVQNAFAVALRVRIEGTSPDIERPTPTPTRPPDPALPLVLRGRVLDASRGGAALEGVRVAAVYCSHRCSAPVRTDADGAYAIHCEGVGPFQRIHVEAWRADLGTWESPATQVTGKRSIEYDFEIDTGRVFLPWLGRASAGNPWGGGPVLTLRSTQKRGLPKLKAPAARARSTPPATRSR